MNGLGKSLVGLGIIAGTVGCKQPDPPPINSPWQDTFERASLAGDYFATSDAYELQGGALHVKGAYNHPLWLRKKLPANAIIELDCRSDSTDGDIKLEAWGDGESYDPDNGRYEATSYVFIFGGWNNSKSMIAKQDEHAPGLPSRTEPKVEPGRSYHWKILRKGSRIDWFVDDLTTPFLTYDDPDTLSGPGHAYLGFNNWASDTTFDNVSITPIP